MCIVQAMPLDWCYSFARMAGWIFVRVFRKHRQIALDNLRHAFHGEYTESQLKKIVEDVYVHFVSLGLEVAHIPRRLRDTTWRRYIQARNQGPLVELVLSGRPVIMLTAHFGNWEMAGYTMGVFGFKPYSVARSLDNPFMEEQLRSIRTRTGQEIVYKRGAFDVVSELMNRRCMVAFLSDQDAGSRGVFVEFFGRPASSHKGVALLALEHDAPICMGFARRMGRGFNFEVWVEDVIEPRDYRNEPDPVWAITQAFTRSFEAVVRRNPEQYLWLHRRWKSQPERAKQPQAA
jgi:KDO2-lipid IV(A) lauroyltransferase